MLSLNTLLPILHEIESPSQHLATRLLLPYSHRQRLTSRELAAFLPSRACHLPLDIINRRTTGTRTTFLSNVAVDASRKRKPPSRACKGCSSRLHTIIRPPQLDVFDGGGSSAARSADSLDQLRGLLRRLSSPSPLSPLPPRGGGCRCWSQARGKEETRKRMKSCWAWAKARPNLCLVLVRPSFEFGFGFGL